MRELFRQHAVPWLNEEMAEHRATPFLGVFVALLFFWGLAIVPVWIEAAQYCHSHYDLGIYTQAVSLLDWDNLNPWLTGRQVFIFNDHFDPILIVAAPLKLLLSPYKAVLVAEALIVSSVVLPVLWLWKLQLLQAHGAVLLASTLLLNSSLITAVRFPVHPTTWAVTPMAWMLAAVIAKRPWHVFWAFNVLCACKEEFPFLGIMLGLALWVMGKENRKLGTTIFFVAVSWGLFDFVFRPMLFGAITSYSTESSTKGQVSLDLTFLLDSPTEYLLTRFTKEGMYSRLLSMLSLTVPLLVWSYRRSGFSKLIFPLFLILLPMLGIRFLGMSWRHQYGAPLMAAILFLLCPLLIRTKIPRWVFLTTCLILVGTNERHLRFGASVLRPGDHGSPRICPNEAGRLESIERAFDILKADSDRKILVEGSFLAYLMPWEKIYSMGGPQSPDGHVYDYVLSEKGFRGTPFPASYERMNELIGLWRNQEGAEIIIDNDYLFFARGNFTRAH